MWWFPSRWLPVQANHWLTSDWWRIQGSWKLLFTIVCINGGLYGKAAHMYYTVVVILVYVNNTISILNKAVVHKLDFLPLSKSIVIYMHMSTHGCQVIMKETSEVTNLTLESVSSTTYFVLVSHPIHWYKVFCWQDLSRSWKKLIKQSPTWPISLM